MCRTGVPRDAWGLVDLPIGGRARHQAVTMWLYLRATMIFRRCIRRKLARIRGGGDDDGDESEEEGEVGGDLEGRDKVTPLASSVASSKPSVHRPSRTLDAEETAQRLKKREQEMGLDKLGSQDSDSENDDSNSGDEEEGEQKKSGPLALRSVARSKVCDSDPLRSNVHLPVYLALYGPE